MGMKCSNCGAMLEPDHMFCGECGAPKPQLPPDFAQAEERFNQLHAAYRAGKLDDQAYESELRKLVLQDASGGYWMLGAESGDWYRFDGQEWVAADPSKVSTTTQQAPATKASKKKRSWVVVPAAGCVVVLCLVVIGAIYYFLSPFSQGFSELLQPAVPVASGELQDTIDFQSQIPAFPAITEPAASMPMASALPAQEEDILATTIASTVAAASSPPAPVWVPVSSPGLGVVFELPDSWQYEHLEDKSMILGEIGEKSIITLDWYKRPEETSAEEELRGWMAVLTDFNWEDVNLGVTPIGPVASSTGRGSGFFPMYEAVVGPTADGYYLFYSLQGPEAEWLEFIPLVEEIMQRAAYSQ